MPDLFASAAPPPDGAIASAGEAAPGAPPPDGSGGIHDTAAGCRERAEADLGRLHVPGREGDRCWHALRAAAWLARAALIERREAEIAAGTDGTRP